MKSVEIINNKNSKNTVEAYKTLRTNIQFCGADIKVIMFTSCEADEGKTTTSMNLATSLAEGGKRIVFVDGDLRRSVFTSRFIQGRVIKGLSHYLSGQCKLSEIIYSSNIDNLSIVPSGPLPPNPTDLFSGREFKECILALREVFDYIIIDTAPLGQVIDAAVVAPICDGVVMIVEQGRIGVKYAQSVKKQLEVTGCPLLGIVLNRVKIAKRGYYGMNGSYNKYMYTANNMDEEKTTV